MNGQLIDDDDIVQMVISYIENDKQANGFVLLDFPKSK